MTEIGTILDGKYEILKLIGKGGMSYVYLAIDNRLNKQWAVKEVRNNIANVDVFIERLVKETNILKKIDHPVIPRIVDILHENDVVYIVMDYVEGRTIADILREEGAQTQEKVVSWGIELAGALSYLHSMEPPIIYRDMKPSNVMLRPDGSIKLIDFGTAKEFDVENLADTTALGTRGYAAPEQFGDSNGRGQYNTDARTDIYSLGATLYHMVTGKNPSEPPYEMKPIRYWDPQLSQGLEKIIKKCTEMDPNKRYANCEELLYDLENYDHLDKRYTRSLWRRIGCWGITVAAVIVFSVLIGYGKHGKQEMLLKEYESMMNAAELSMMEGDYTKALNELQVAITEIDSTREEAYKGMLNIYGAQNQLEDGLTSICKYIDTYQGERRPPEEIIFEISKEYFYEREYKKCYKYASMVDKIEEADYYAGLAKILSSLYVDDVEYKEELVAFKQYTLAMENTQNKFDNYKALAMVYVTGLGTYDGVADSAIEVCELGREMLRKPEEWIEKDTNITQYKKQFLEYEIKAYEWLKEHASEESEKKSYYLNLEALYEEAITLLDESVEEDRNTKLLKQLALVEIYAEQQRYKEALAMCEQLEKVYTLPKDNVKSIYMAHIRVLGIEGELTKEKKKQIVEVKEKAENSIPDIKDDYEWKKLFFSIDL